MVLQTCISVAHVEFQPTASHVQYTSTCTQTRSRQVDNVPDYYSCVPVSDTHLFRCCQTNMTDTVKSEPEQLDAPEPADADTKPNVAASDAPAAPGITPDDDRDAPDLSLKTPGLSDKNNNLKVELAEGEGGVDQSEFYSSGSSFEDLGLSKPLLDGLYNEMGFKSPSSIQATTLPLILAPPHRHLIAQGHNGCGKTTCFALAMLSRCAAKLFSSGRYGWTFVTKHVPDSHCAN